MIDLTPGFNLGITEAWNNVTGWGNSVGSQPSSYDNPTGSVSQGTVNGDNQGGNAPVWGGVVQGANVGAAPNPSPAPTNNYQAPPVDPNAQWGGQAAYDARRSGYATQKQGILNSTNSRIGSEGRGMRSGILDYIDQLRAGQSKIDNSAVNNELARDQGTGDILEMVRNGSRSGMGMLSNKNAGDSSASSEIDRAYAALGGREMGKVGSQYELADRDIGLEQQSLDLTRQTQKRKLDESQDQTVDTIVGEAQNAQIAGSRLWSLGKITAVFVSNGLPR
jgi:hypothetical protein